MSSWPGSVIPHWRTSSSSRVGVSKASSFRFVAWTVCSPYPTLNLRRPSFSSCHCMDLEQSSTAYHICSVTSRLLLSLEDILLRTLLSIITVVVPAKWHCHYGHVNHSYLLNYLSQFITYSVILLTEWKTDEQHQSHDLLREGNNSLFKRHLFQTTR